MISRYKDPFLASVNPARVRDKIPKFYCIISGHLSFLHWWEMYSFHVLCSTGRFDSILLHWLGRSKDCMSREHSCIAISISGILPVLAPCCDSLVPYQLGCFQTPQRAFQSSTTMVRNVLAALCEPPAETCSGFHFST